MKRLVLLRPEPGLSASAARARALGLEVVTHPLFRVEPLEAAMPAGNFDAVVFTSANAVRFGGALREAARRLPALAVGEATADALRGAGIVPKSVGGGGVAGLDLPPGRLLHPCGERHKPLSGGAVSVPVYRTVANQAPLPDIGDAVLAVHSAAAGECLSMLVDEGRSSAVIAAISADAAAACGDGWLAVECAAAPDDDTLLALAARLCQSSAP